MYTYRKYVVVNGEQYAKNIQNALELLRQWYLAQSNGQLNIIYTMQAVNDTVSYVRGGYWNTWYVDPKIIANYDTEAVGCHDITFFYNPEEPLFENWTSVMNETLTLDGKPQTQIRCDTDIVGLAQTMEHEMLHAMAQNLNIKGIKYEDLRYDQDLQGVPPMEMIEQDFQKLVPYLDVICQPMPVDTYINLLNALLTTLKMVYSLLLPSKYQQFKNKYLGKGIDTDGYYGNQCTDVYHKYCDFIGADSFPISVAKDIWDRYDTSFFEKIPYEPGMVPNQGDIIIWGMSPAGHVAIFDNGNPFNFQTIGQNWSEAGTPNDGKGVLCVENHRYVNVLGWLRKI